MSDKQAKEGRGAVWLPLVLVAIGVLLLLNNFLLLPDFNALALTPLILVVVGVLALLRGDLLPSESVRTFAITRGSVQAAALEISAGEIDVNVRALQREGRLIAGQYAAESRPELRVNDEDASAILRMDRAATPWLAFADWEIGLARDLPWRLFVSTSLGQAQLDLSGLIVQDVTVATGVGDIRVTCPDEALDGVRLQSALGSITVVTPPGCAAHITVEGGRFFGVHADPTRYEAGDDGAYSARDAVQGVPLVRVHVAGTFGDLYLA